MNKKWICAVSQVEISVFEQVIVLSQERVLCIECNPYILKNFSVPFLLIKQKIFEKWIGYPIHSEVCIENAMTMFLFIAKFRGIEMNIPEYIKK